MGVDVKKVGLTWNGEAVCEGNAVVSEGLKKRRERCTGNESTATGEERVERMWRDVAG